MTKILYINPLGEDIHCISYINDTIITEDFHISFLYFAENFPKILTEKYHQHQYNEIWLFSGPWSFTKMRIITLAINALKFSHTNIVIKSRHFFDFFQNTNIIPLIEANTNEFLFYKNGEYFVKKTELPAGKYTGFFHETSTNFDKCRQTSTNVEYSIYVDNPVDIRHFFENISPNDFSEPFYIKPPHITHAKHP